MSDFIFIGSIFCALISAYLLLFNKTNIQSFSNRILAVLFLCYSYCVIGYLLITSGWLIYMPFIYKTAAPINYLIPPIAYLYVRSVLKNESKFQKKDILHFLPFAFILINYIPLYSMGYNEKLNIVQLVVKNYDQNVLSQDGFFTEKIQILRPIQTVLYLFLQFKLITNFQRENENQFFVAHTNLILGWLKKFTNAISFTVLTFLILVFGVIYNLVNGIQINNLVYYASIPIALSLLYLSSYLILHPQVLFGLPYLEKIGNNKSKSSNKELNYDIEIAHINDYVIINQPYLKQSLSIHELSALLNISPKSLSFILNQYFNQNFNDFINAYRVQFVINAMQNGELKNFTIQALGLKAGFTNKTSFISAFKKIHLCTPSQYITDNSILK